MPTTGISNLYINPDGADFPIVGTTWDTALVYAEGVFYYFMEIGSMAGTDLYLATYTGPLRE